MDHLNEQSLAELLRDPNAQAGLRAHLRTPCETCEAFLSTHEVEGLEGVVDELALGLAPERPASLDQVGWQRLRRTLGRPPARRWGVAVALAAGLAVLVAAPVVLRARTASTEDGLKGPATLHLDLLAAARQADGAINRIGDGSTVHQDSTLLFRYTANEHADATLWIIRDQQAPQRLGTVELMPGSHELVSTDGTLVGVSMQGEVGQVTVVVVAGRAGAGPGEPPTALGRVDSEPGAAGRVTVHVHP